MIINRLTIEKTPEITQTMSAILTDPVYFKTPENTDKVIKV